MVRSWKCPWVAACVAALMALATAESRACGPQVTATAGAFTVQAVPTFVSPLVFAPATVVVQPQFVSVAQVAAVPVAVSQVVVPQVVAQQVVVQQRVRVLATPRVVVQGVHCR